MEDQNWLKQRLERERSKAWTSLGFATEAEAKAAAEAGRAAADAKKTAEQRATEASEQLKTANAELERHRAATKEYAARMLGGLTAEQKAAVDAIAGDDPTKQVTAITALTPTWTKQAADAAAAAGTPITTNTAPPAGAPGGSTTPDPSPRATYEQARQTNPFAAARYGQANPSVYDPRK